LDLLLLNCVAREFKEQIVALLHQKQETPRTNLPITNSQVLEVASDESNKNSSPVNSSSETKNSGNLSRRDFDLMLGNFYIDPFLTFSKRNPNPNLKTMISRKKLPKSSRKKSILLLKN